MRRRTIRILVVCAILALAACRKPAPAPQPPPPAPPPPPPPPQSLFVLLPEQPGRANGATVTNQAGSQELSTPNTVVRVARADTPPAPAAPIDPAEVRRIFGSAIDVLPAEQLSFNLYFDVNTANLTAASQAELPAVLQAIRDRKSTLISVTGHTDTTGTREGNLTLSLQRAEAIAAQLRAIGVTPEKIFVGSHGQDDPLVASGPNQNVPQNRRVEVIVR